MSYAKTHLNLIGSMKPNYDLPTLVLLSVSLFLACLSNIYGQQNGKPLPKVNGESSQIVNLYTGRLSVNMPLASVSGRGEGTAGINLLNQGQANWRIVETDRHYHPVTAQLLSIDYAAFINYADNLPNNYKPMSLSFEVAKGLVGLNWYASGAMSSYLVLRTSDGNRVEFRDVLRDGEPTELNPVSSNGPVVQCNVTYGIVWIPGAPPPPAPPPPPAYCSRGNVFRSTDGSAMTFVSDNEVFDAHNTDPNDPSGTVNYFAFVNNSHSAGHGISGFLYLADGTKYRISGGEPTHIIDQNGNITTFSYEAQPLAPVGTLNCNNDSDYLSGCRLSKITDSIGREVSISYGTVSDAGYFDTISYKGFRGAERQIEIHYDRMINALYPGQAIEDPIRVTVNVPAGSNFNSTEAEQKLGKYGKMPANQINSSNTEMGHNPIVISRITLPNNQEYQFKYNSFGEIARVKVPTGAYTDYTYGPLPNPRVCTSLVESKRTDPNGLTWVKYPWFPYELPDAIVRRVTESKVFDETGTLQNTTTYSDIGSEHPVMVAAKDPNNITLQASKHYFFNEPCQNQYPFSAFTRYFDDWRENREYKTEAYANENSSSPLRISETFFAPRAPIPWLANHPFAEAAYASNDLRVTETKTTLETGQVTKQTFDYDQFNNVTDTYEYDYGNGQAGQFLRRSHTDFVTDSNYINYTGAHLRRLPLQSWVSSDLAGNNKVSRMQYEYDNYNTNALVLRTNVSGHDTSNYGTSNTRRGNVTKTTSYADAQNQTGAISSLTQYDILGNVVKTVDANGCMNTFDYTDRFGSPDGEARANSYPSQLNGLNAFAFATSATDCRDNTSFSQFDFHTSVAVDSEDVNGNVATALYDDVLDRPTQTISANNRQSLRSQTAMEYDDVIRKVTVTSDLNSFGDNLTKAVSFYDSLGRTTETRSYETGGYIVTSKPQYDSLSRVVQSTNPYRPFLGEQPVWTTTTYDVLGRVSKITTPDNLDATSSYFGNATTVIDQAGKKRRSITNAIGQVIRVDEPNNANELGDITGPAQPTYYSYNTVGNLVKVAQGQQNRYFLYDSLGRLIRVRQPEQNTNPALAMTDPITGNSNWSTGSTYDANGNALTTTDAKGTVITSTYDNLNRRLTATYSDGTPTVTYQYDDTNVPNSKGQLTKLSSTVSETRYTQFDELGRIKTSQQLTTPEQRIGTQAPYTMAYSYNLSGALIEETYPSGRVVKNTLDNDGRLKDLSSKSLGQTDFRVYANNFVYAASGAVTSMRLGNGRWESAQFNSRLQVTQLGLGHSQGATTLWKANYEYGEIDAGGSLKNNGNIASQTINFMGLSHAFVQTYKYDSLSRLTEAKEMNDTTQTWIQNFGYDRYGNRTSFNQQKIGEQQITETPAVDPASNRFTTGQGFVYDFNGNLINDNQGRQFTFNGDNKQVEVTDSANNQIGLYYYDGSGARVMKISVTEMTIFVYDAGGKLVAEYSTQTSTNPNISYLTTDTLGSPRVVTDNSGNVISRRDFMPFGEELNAGTANRVTTHKYSESGTDTVRKRFTGYEKDTETKLDFAEARMYNNQHGRFTAVDPLLASGLSANPQTFNRYAYVINNPTNATDPTGMWSDHQWNSIEPPLFSNMYDDGPSIRHPIPLIEYKKTTTIRRSYRAGNPFAPKYGKPISTSTTTTESVNGDVVSSSYSSSINQGDDSWKRFFGKTKNSKAVNMMILNVFGKNARNGLVRIIRPVAGLITVVMDAARHIYGDVYYLESQKGIPNTDGVVDPMAQSEGYTAIENEIDRSAEIISVNYSGSSRTLLGRKDGARSNGYFYYDQAVLKKAIIRILIASAGAAQDDYAIKGSGYN